MDTVLEDAESRQLSLKLWPAATAEGSQASDVRRQETAVARSNPRGAFEMADVIAGRSMEVAMLDKAYREASREDGLEPDWATTGCPRSKISMVAARPVIAEQIRRSEALSGRANVTRSCGLNLRCVAAGARFRARFCETTGNAFSSIRRGGAGAARIFRSWWDASATRTAL